MEIRLGTEQPQNSKHLQPLLREVVDLSELGPREADQLTSMSTTITAPPVLDPARRRTVMRHALTYLAHQFGYIEAPEDLI